MQPPDHSRRPFAGGGPVVTLSHSNEQAGVPPTLRHEERIYYDLLARIQSGDYPQGTRLPTEHDLAAEFGVSRPVIRAALARLREVAADLITGSGSAIGLPTIRAGKTVTMDGLGARFNGTYRLTQTTHAIGGSGYTTTFQARKEVLENG